MNYLYFYTLKFDYYLLNFDYSYLCYKAKFTNKEGISNYKNLFFNNKIKWQPDLTPLNDNLKVKHLYCGLIVYSERAIVSNEYMDVMNAGHGDADSEKSIIHYLKALSIEPKRVEPLYYAAQACRVNKQWELAYLFAKKAFDKMSRLDLFSISNFEEGIYVWKLLDELSVCSYWVKNYKESYKLAKKTLKLVPLDQLERIKSNLKFCENHLKKPPGIKFKNKLSQKLAKLIAKLSLNAHNIVEFNKNNEITSLIQHYSPDRCCHLKISKTKQLLKQASALIEKNKLVHPKYKLFSQSIFTPHNIDFAVINEENVSSKILMHLIWRKIKSKGKILIKSGFNFNDYLVDVKVLYPNYKKTGYDLVVKK